MAVAWPDNARRARRRAPGHDPGAFGTERLEGGNRAPNRGWLGMIRVVLADDHALVLDGLERVLRSQPDIDIVARCTTGEAALAAVDRWHPDVLVLDLVFPDMSG